MIDFLETRITSYPKLKLKKNIDLRVKHDDEFPFAGGGNKARKSLYVISEIIEKGYNCVITTGSIYSNQIRTVSAICAYYGISCHLIIIDDNRFSSRETINLKLANNYGAKISFTSFKEFDNSLKDISLNYSKKGFKPFFFDNSGKSIISLKAYINAGKNLINQLNVINWWPEFIFVPCGTGLTLLGLSISLINKPIKIIGISISRKKERLEKELYETAKIYNSHEQFNLENLQLIINDEFNDNGYGSYNDEIIHTIRNCSKKGLILDPIYTSKAFLGLISLTEKSISNNSKILFWHTGSLYNYLDNELNFI